METLSLDLRPGKHAEVELGPALLRGSRTVHVVLDHRANRLYEMGAREHFVLSRLDGRRTLSVVGEQYAANFGRRLGAAEWVRILALFASRNLLAGVATPEAAAALRQHAPAAPVAPAAPAARAPAGLWRGDRTLPGLSALPERVYPWLRPCLSGYVLAGAAIAVLGMLATLGYRVPELASQASGLLSAPWLLLPVLVLLCASVAFHELAHALVARHLGVRVTRIGLRWNLPLVVPYCKAEGVLVLPIRRQRAGAAAAGPFSHWVFLLPFFAAWLALPSGEVRDATGTLLLVNSAMGLVNCIPWPGTDGYLVVSSALNVSHLYSESFRYVRLIGRGRDARAAYPARARCLYAGYATMLCVVNATLLAALILLGVHAVGAR